MHLAKSLDQRKFEFYIKIAFSWLCSHSQNVIPITSKLVYFIIFNGYPVSESSNRSQKKRQNPASTNANRFHFSWTYIYLQLNSANLKLTLEKHFNFVSTFCSRIADRSAYFCCRFSENMLKTLPFSANRVR